MTLSSRLADLSLLLDDVKAKSGGEKAARVYDELSSKFTMYDEVEETKNRRLFLKGNGVSVKSLESDAIRVSNLAVKILERFNEMPEHTSLTRGTNFTKVIEELETFNQIQKKSLENDWKEHCAGMFIEFSPDNVQAAIPNTPDNERPLKAWVMAYNSYLEIVHEVPSETNVIERIQKVSDKLKEIYSGFNLDVPVEVSSFFNGVKDGTATLELLTPTVVKYLGEKALLNKYRVSPRDKVFEPRNG